VEIFELLKKTAFTRGFSLKRDHKRALRKMQTCHTVERGGRILACHPCNLKVVMYNPCNQRGCPQCSKKNQIKWKLKTQKKILPTNHYHLVFSIPQRFTFIWLQEKQEIVNSLFSSVHKSIHKMEKEYGLIFGYILSFQSHGRGLSYKPHIHCILTAGGMDKELNWIPQGSIIYSSLKETFKEEFYNEIKSRTKIKDSLNLKDIKDHEWSVYPTYHKDTGKPIVEYLSHSMSGVVLDLKQTFKYSNNETEITFTEIHRDKSVTTTLTTKVFTERYLNHIPPPGTVTVRYYGIYSNRYTSELKYLRKRIPNNEVNDIEKDDISEMYICPECKSRMIILYEFAPNTKVNFELFGFIHGPPHGTIQKAA